MITGTKDIANATKEMMKNIETLFKFRQTSNRHNNSHSCTNPWHSLQ